MRRDDGDLPSGCFGALIAMATSTGLGVLLIFLIAWGCAWH